MIDWDTTMEWLLEHGIRILIILTVSMIVYVLLRKIVPRFINQSLLRTMKDDMEVEIEKRQTTLNRLFHTTSGLVIIIITVFLVLNEIGINIAALLAGFGIAGIAIGFGAQSLVRDLIAGFMIQIENPTKGINGPF